MLRLRGKAVDEEQKDSGEEQRDEDEGLGPRSNISLLDQHQHLKEKAEGIQFKDCRLWNVISGCFILFTLRNSLSHLVSVIFNLQPERSQRRRSN